VNGGCGNDRIYSSTEDDIVRGSTGADTLTGGPGADKFECYLETDTVTDFNSEEATLIKQTVKLLTPPPNHQLFLPSSFHSVLLLLLCSQPNAIQP
jgi:RTX calcium-binding nonapeptide repeat (4 copies)